MLIRRNETSRGFHASSGTLSLSLRRTTRTQNTTYDTHTPGAWLCSRTHRRAHSRSRAAATEDLQTAFAEALASMQRCQRGIFFQQPLHPEEASLDVATGSQETGPLTNTESTPMQQDCGQFSSRSRAPGPHGRRAHECSPSHPPRSTSSRSGPSHVPMGESASHSNRPPSVGVRRNIRRL